MKKKVAFRIKAPQYLGWDMDYVLVLEKELEAARRRGFVFRTVNKRVVRIPLR